MIPDSDTTSDFIIKSDKEKNTILIKRCVNPFFNNLHIANIKYIKPNKNNSIRIKSKNEENESSNIT